MRTEGFSELAAAIIVETKCEVGLKFMMIANTAKKQMFNVNWSFSTEWACFVSDARRTQAQVDAAAASTTAR